jgi:histone-lysine N-methyltransferase SETMAR
LSTAEAFQYRELFDHLPYTPDLTPSDYHLFTYLKNWLQSQCFNNNEELMGGIKIWLCSQTADSFDTGEQEAIPRYASIPVVIMLRSS